MPLTIVGRYQLTTGGITSFYAVAQDPNNLDSMYGLYNDGVTYKLYKFTWPSTMTFLVDTGVAPFAASYIYNVGVIGQDFMYGVGMIDETYHYAFALVGTIMSPDPSLIKIIDVNLDTLGVTVYQANAGDGTNFEFVPLVLTFDGIGSYFTLGGRNYVVKKRYGQATGTITTVTDAWKPWLMIDDQSWAYPDDPNWYRLYASGTPAKALLGAGATYLPVGATLGGDLLSGHSYGRTSPGRTLLWDDDWRYMLWMLYAGAEGWLVAVRKHLGSGVYTWAILSKAANYAQGQVDGAFDIWQTGVTGAPGTVRKVFFSAGGFRDRIYSSLAWPMSMDNSVEIDTGGASVVQPIFIATNDEYAYVVHYTGTTWGACITKIKDTDLIAEPPASPSISATGAKVVWKDKRVFFIKVPGYGRHLWWGAPFEPQSLDPSWDGYNTPVFENEDNTTLLVFADMVYIGSRAGWKRLRGKTPDYWVLDDIDSVVGPVTDKSVAVTPFGAIYPREDGLYLFNGYSARIFYPQAKTILENVNWNVVEKAFSVWDGRYFRFFYPRGASVVNDRELVVDLVGGLENARATESDRAASGGFYDPVTKILFLGDEDGNLEVAGSSGSRALEVVTKEFPAQGLLQAGTFQRLHYDADTQGETITVTAYYDGVEQAPVTISTTSRKRGQVSLPKGNAYRVGIKIAVTTDKDVKLYEPWTLE